MEKLVRRGAEADIFLSQWLLYPAVVKRRVPRGYRHPKLDFEIRRRRTIHEASFLVEARKAGVPTPLIYFLDAENSTIIMQFIAGERLKELAGKDDVVNLGKLFIEVGRYIGLLHSTGIIHGDLTTSNLILHRSGRLVLIDFGLSFYSERLEDAATDLHLLKEVLVSGHNRVATPAFEHVLEGYASVVGSNLLANIQTKVREIERRGRYARVD